MVRAAVEYKLHGEAGLKSVMALGFAWGLSTLSPAHAAETRKNPPYDAQKDAFLKEAFQLTKVTVGGTTYRIANFTVRHLPASKQAVFFIDGDILHLWHGAATPYW